MQNQISFAEYTSTDTIKENNSIQQTTPLRRTFTSASVSAAKYLSEQFSPTTSLLVKLGGSLNGNGGNLQRSDSQFCESGTQFISNGITASSTQNTIKKINRQTTLLERQSKFLGRQSTLLDRINPSLSRQDTLSQERHHYSVNNGGNLTSTQHRINRLNSQNTNLSQDKSLNFPQDNSQEIITMNSANKPKFFFLENNKQEVSLATRQFKQRQSTIIQHKRAQTQNKEIKLSKISSPIEQHLNTTDSSQTQRQLELNSEYNSLSPLLTNNQKSRQQQQQQNQQYQEIDQELQDRLTKFDCKQIIGQYNSIYGSGSQQLDKQRWSISSQQQNNSQLNQTQQNKDLLYKNDTFNLKDIHYYKDTLHSKAKSYLKDSLISNDMTHLNQSKDNSHIKENSQNKNRISINTNLSELQRNSIHSPYKNTEKTQFLQVNSPQTKYLQSPLSHESSKSQELSLVEQYKLSVAKQKKKNQFQQNQHNSLSFQHQGNDRVFSQSFCNNMLPSSEQDKQVNRSIQILQKTDRSLRVGQVQRLNNNKSGINENNQNNLFQVDENKFREIISQKLNKVSGKTNSNTQQFNQIDSIQNKQMSNNQLATLQDRQILEHKQQTNFSQFKQIDSQNNQQLPYIPLSLIEENENNQVKDTKKNQQFLIKIKTESNNSSPKKTVQIISDKQDSIEKPLNNSSHSKRGSHVINSFNVNNDQSKEVKLLDIQKKHGQTNSVECIVTNKSKNNGQQQYFNNKKNRFSEQLLPQQILKLQNSISNNTQNLQLNKKSQSTNPHQNEVNTQQTQLQQQKSDLQITITPQQIKQIVETEKKKKRMEQQNVIYNLVKQVEENSLDKVNQKNQGIIDQEITKKAKSRNSLINDVLKQKNKQSIAVIQDILRMNNVTEIPEIINSPDQEDAKRKTHQFTEQSKTYASDHLTNKCKNHLGFSQTLYDLKITNSQFMNSINNMVNSPSNSSTQNTQSNKKNKISFKEMQYQDIVKEYQTSSNYYNDSLSPRDKNPQQIEKINENRYFQQIIKDQSNQKKNGLMLRKALKEALHYLNKLQISPAELTKGVVFSTKPFQKKHSREFIIAAKKGDFLAIKDLVLETKYLVYDFDFVYLTALHWACKRSHIQIAQLLVQYGSDVDAKDLLLLMGQANPWSTPEYNINDLAKDNPELTTLLSKFRKLDIVSKMCKPGQRQDFWKRQSYFIDQKGTK